MAREMTFTGSVRISGLSAHQITALWQKYVNEAVSSADISEARRVIAVAEGMDAATVHGKPSEIERVRIDLCSAFIIGVCENLPNAKITFGKFHRFAPASETIDNMRRIEWKLDPSIMGKQLGPAEGSRLAQRRTGL